MAEKRCWEIKGCERGPGGKLVYDLGECPTIKYLNTDNYQLGSDCWKTRVKDESGKLVPNWARKETDCLACAVFEKLRKEEGPL